MTKSEGLQKDLERLPFIGRADASREAPARHDGGWQSWITWGGWGLATIFAIAATAVHGRWLPWSDDFDIIPWITGDRPVTFSWLWLQHNEHRIPLPKLLFVGIGWLSGADYRWTLCFNALLLAALAAAMIGTAKHLRGRTNWTDLLFPAFILNLGQGGIEWAFQLQFTLTTVLAGLFVAAALAFPRPSIKRTACMSACASLVVLTGANGLLFAMPAALLLLYEGLRGSTCPVASPLLARSLALTSSAFVLVVVLGYGVGLNFPHAADKPTLVQISRATLDALASYPGRLASTWRTFWWVFTPLAISVTVAAIVAGSWQDRLVNRPALVVLLGFLGGLILVATAIGYGRGARDFAHLHSHYSSLLLGVPVCLQLLWVALPQGRLARGFQALLCVVALAVYVHHARHAARRPSWEAESWAGTIAALRGPLSPEAVAARHTPELYFLDTPEVRDNIAACVTMLRRTTFPLYCVRTGPP